MKLDRITANPSVCEGQPTVRGMRITVAFVLKLIASGYDVAQILREYPELEAEDIKQAAAYGAMRVDERIFPTDERA